MALIKVLPTGQVTLPPELRRRFKLGDGTYLDATKTRNPLGTQHSALPW